MAIRIVLLGAPGSGKGTQSGPLAERYAIPHISTGDIFREAVKNKTELGEKVREYLHRGELVPLDIAVEVTRARLSQEDCARGFLLDGFPRSKEQATALHDILDEMQIELDAVLNMEASTDVLVHRLTSRRVCENCGATYNLLFKPPQVEGVCDACGGPVTQRKDDREETVRNRLVVYDRQTRPLIEFYESTGILHHIDAEQDIPDITSSINAALNGMAGKA